MEMLLLVGYIILFILTFIYYMRLVFMEDDLNRKYDKKLQFSRLLLFFNLKVDNYPGSRALLFGNEEFPKETEFSRIILIYRILFIVVIIPLIIMLIELAF